MLQAVLGRRPKTVRIIGGCCLRAGLGFGDFLPCPLLRSAGEINTMNRSLQIVSSFSAVSSTDALRDNARWQICPLVSEGAWLTNQLMNRPAVPTDGPTDGTRRGI
jgi:hypothetical protein